MPKKKEVVYVAPNSNIKSIVEDKTIPPYEDTAVKFQGYSKKNLGNEYRINPQNKIIIHDTITGATEESIYDIPEGKKLCISSAIISHNKTVDESDVMVFYLTDGDSGVIPPERIQFYYRFTYQNQDYRNFLFEPVLELRNAVWVAQSGGETLSTDITFYCWLEDI